jgi:hypothetical protein
MKTTLALICSLAFVAPVLGYESAFAPTEPGAFEVKTLPAARVLATGTSGTYFSNADGLFMRLFRYIDREEIPMTVPVEAVMEPAKMRFFLGKTPALRDDLAPAGEVFIEALEERVVASAGARGGYTAANFERVKKELEAWVAGRPDLAVAGEATAIFWNGPFVPGFLKRFEVHLPVRVLPPPR